MKKYALIILVGGIIVLLIGVYFILFGRMSTFKIDPNYPTEPIECTSNSDCPSGKVCWKFTENPSDNKCTEPGLGSICGDKKCDNAEYKGKYCPEDCG